MALHLSEHLRSRKCHMRECAFLRQKYKDADQLMLKSNGGAVTSEPEKRLETSDT
jgi:hypothetical protein